MPNTIPIVKSGTARIEITFKSPTPAQPLQTCYWIGVYPTMVSVDEERKVSTSFRTA